MERSISKIIQYLYDKYGEMILEQMMNKEKEIKRYMFNPVQHMFTVLIL